VKRLALLLLFTLTSAAHSASPEAVRAMELVNAGDLADARAHIERRLDAGSTSNELLYQLARLECADGNTSRAQQALTAALAAGFTDYFRMTRDPMLEPMRGEPGYETIAKNRRTLLEDRAEADFEAVRRAFDKDYAFERVAGLRLQFACAHGDQVLREVVAEARSLSGWVHRELWDAPADPGLDPWVTVILPSPEHFVMLVGAGGAGGGVGGYYDPETRRLVASDLGPSLRHELMHVFHFRRLERLGQPRPLWLTEGLATLPETLDPHTEGIVPVACWRTDIARRRLAAGRLRGWDDLFAQGRDRFVGHRPRAQYAQARAVVMFLHDQQLLRSVLDAFERTGDLTGAAAVEEADGRPLKRIEKRFRGWLATLDGGEPDERERLRELGLVLSAGRGIGPLIDHVELRSPASAARMRSRDVIRTVDGRVVRTVAEFLRAVAGDGEREVGLLRGRASVTVTLRARE